MDKLYNQVSAVSNILGHGEKILYESEKAVRAKLRGDVVCDKQHKA